MKGVADMARRVRLTDKGVANLKPRVKRYAVSDAEVTGHWIRVQPSGSKSYVAVAIAPSGKQVWQPQLHPAVGRFFLANRQECHFGNAASFILWTAPDCLRFALLAR
jgi:hypothetical protein